MAKALELAEEEEEKKKETSTEKTGWKSTSHSVWEQVFQTQKCVTPPLTSDIVKCLSAHLANCIYDEPEAMIDSPDLLLLCACVCIT